MAGSGLSRSLPTGRLGRLLALAIALALLLALWEAIGSPLMTLYHDRADALAERRAVAVHMAALAAQLPALRRVAAAGIGRSEPVALIEGSSDAIAAASLQEQVQQMASGLGATLSSTESLPAASMAAATPGAASSGGYRRVGVRIAVTAPYDVMVRLLAAIEQASPSMLIDDLQLHGSRIQLQPNAPIDGSLTVLAFRHGGGPASGQSSPAGTEPGPDGGTEGDVSGGAGP